jgi:hypothetical protein
MLSMQQLIYYFSQTLTTLNLSDNEIRDQGGKHLANALEQNKVTQLTLLYF